jgi:hypothetical protein
MQTVVALTWIAIRILHIVSLLLLLGGVALFGWNLMRTVSRQRQAGQDDTLSSEIWRGKPVRFALKIFGAGVGLQLLSIVFAIVVPNSR